jgi:CelD/BcsL family acetyltransferase involved in cellulose biosynthesis
MICETLEHAKPTIARPGRISSSTLTDPAELAKLALAWPNLAAAYGPTEQFVWAASCRATLDARRPLRIVQLNRDERCVGLAPLVLRRVRGMRRLAPLGLSDLHEPMDLVASDADALERLTAAVVARREPLVIDRMLANSPTLAAFEKSCRGRAIFVRRSAANCPYITLDASWLDPASHLNSGRRSDLRRARRKAEQAGAVSIEILSPQPAEVDALLDKAMAIEAKSWKGTARTALAYDRHRAEFFRHYAHEAAREGILRICFLHIGDQPAAMQIAVEQNGGFWLLKIGYDAEFSSASPGLLLMQETIRYAAEAGLTSYEFLGRAEAWTTVWTNQERKTVTVRIYPFSSRGMLALAVDALAAGCRKLPGFGRRLAGTFRRLTSNPKPKADQS